MFTLYFLSDDTVHGNKQHFLYSFRKSQNRINNSFFAFHKKYEIFNAYLMINHSFCEIC